MNCKNCNGDLSFENGELVCLNCNSTFATEILFENIEVYICYEECDAFGRRTKDSIIAQNVYQKLEAAKINTFYERISLDGIFEAEMEHVRCSAIRKAKAILVLASSVENFDTITKKYRTVFNEKIVIPFCVDVNPNFIPQELKKIQAINYNTIGWEKDLVNNLYNLLEKEKVVDINKVYADTRKKNKIIIAIILCILLLALLCTGTLVTCKILTNINVSESQDTTLSQTEIYDNANKLMNEEKFIEALALFSTIPDHPDSANMINQIYSKYEGYYKSDDISMHVEISDNVRADIKITITTNNKLIQISEIAQVSMDSIIVNYVDNLDNTGRAEIRLENTGLSLKLYTASQTENTEKNFLLSEKSEQPFVQLDASTLITWLEDEITLEQIKALGYELEFSQTLLPHDSGGGSLYQIKDTDIFLSISAHKLTGITAPAYIAAPSLIGKTSEPVLNNNILYYPNGYLISKNINWYEPYTYKLIFNPTETSVEVLYCWFNTYYDESSDEIIKENSIIVFTTVPDSTDEIWFDYNNVRYEWKT